MARSGRRLSIGGAMIIFRRSGWLFVFLLLGSSLLLVRAQIGSGVKARGFVKFPHYENNKIRAMLSGKEAQLGKAGEIVVTEFRMETYRDGDANKRELVAEAPECVINRSNLTAYSAGSLRVVTANEQFLITGEGFLCEPKAGRFYISNKVHTILRRELMSSTNKKP